MLSKKSEAIKYLPKEEIVSISLCLSREDYRALWKRAQTFDTVVQDVIQRAIDYYLDSKEA